MAEPADAGSGAGRWVHPKEAAWRSGLHPRTVQRWAAAGLIVAKRLARGTGPWRVLVDSDGHPVDALPPVCLACTRAPRVGARVALSVAPAVDA